ncbi:hypothetical protein PMY35_00975 [Clostridium tertium]|uniref:hypothetical protein n=1 Tax=Clostridium tertium TaxID=1559 RepID=UPI00189E88A9|nr:hypothetical protein [Clostridium tertium]MDB1946378.1 hypothetical protein [Clostridium tertium]
MRKTDEEKIEGWNKTIRGMGKPVQIIKITKTVTERGSRNKPYYKIYVNARCKDGCQIKHTLLSNLLKKNRKVPCKCYSNKANIIGKTLVDWCLEKKREDIIQAYSEDKHRKDKYISLTTRLDFTCQLCGEKFTTTLESLLRKDDVICNKHLNRITFPQAAIAHYFKKLGYNPRMEYKYGNRSYDVYIEKLNLLIEYDGARWHKNVEDDIRKCKETLSYDNNINILRIREDGCPNFPQDIRNVEILKCNTSISKMLAKLKEYLIHKFKLIIRNEYNLEENKSEIYMLIKRYYKENSIFTKCPELVRALDNDNVEILKYITVNTKIKLNWKCDICKESFKATPISIKRRLEKEGHLECDSCKLKVNNLKLWFSNQEKFTLISVVSGKKASRIKTKSGEEIIVKCNKCNNIITNKTYKITTYDDCPRCGRNKKSLGDILSERKDISIVTDSIEEIKKIPHQAKQYLLFRCKLCDESCIEKHQARWLHRGGKIKCKKNKVKKIRIAKEGNKLIEYCPQIINEYDFNRNTRELDTLTPSSSEKIYLIGREEPMNVYDYFKKQKRLGLIKKQ